TARSRARVFGRAATTLCASESESLAATTAEGFDPRERLVVESAAPATPNPNANDAQPAKTEASAKIVGDEPEQVAVDVRGVGGPSWLFLADAFAAGWSATLDGTAVEIVAADHAFRAVELPPGDHTVVFRYAAPGRAAAVWITGLSAVATAAFVVVGGWLERGEKRRAG